MVEEEGRKRRKKALGNLEFRREGKSTGVIRGRHRRGRTIRKSDLKERPHPTGEGRGRTARTSWQERERVMVQM